MDADEVKASENAALVPIEERRILFYGDEIATMLVDQDGRHQVYVQLRPICEYLGLSWAGQLERARRDPVLNEALAVIRVTRTTATGGVPAMISLPLDLLPGWLFGIDTRRVKTELQEKITRYRRECFRVLWEAFQTDALAVVNPATLTHDPRVTALAGQIDRVRAELTFLREHLSAILLAEDRIEDVAGRLEQATTLLEQLVGHQTQQAAQLADTADLAAGLAVAVAKIDERTARLTPAHCRAVQDQVTSIVEETARQRKPVSYSRLYGSLKHRFGVGSYSEIADEQFDRVLAYLRAEFQRVTGGTAPQQDPLF